MSKTTDNRWKRLRRTPSSTAGARRALALAYSSIEGVSVSIRDDGSVFNATVSWRDRRDSFSEPTLPLLAVRLNRIISGWSRRHILDQSEAMLRLSEAYHLVCESNSKLLDLYVGRNVSR